MGPRTNKKSVMPVCQRDKKILTVPWLWAYGKKHIMC